MDTLVRKKLDNLRAVSDRAKEEYIGLLNTIFGTEYVQIIDVMGNDLRNVNAARASMRKIKTKFGGKDSNLIKFLAIADPMHFTPFTHSQLTFNFNMPEPMFAQWDKTRVGMSINKTSRRYVDDEPEFYTVKEWRSRPPENIKQGSGEPVSSEIQLETSQDLAEFYEISKKYYAKALANNIAPEQARFFFASGFYGTFFQTGSLLAFARVCNLRIDSHAQKETREYAEMIYPFLNELFPHSWPFLVKKSELITAELSKRKDLEIVQIPEMNELETV